MSIDAQLIEQFTQGINAPSESQAGHFAVATSAAPMNLAYESPSAFALKLASEVVDHTASPTASTVASGGGTHVLDFSTTTGKRYDLRVRAMSENGADDVLFDEERKLIVTNPVGTAIIKSNVVAYTNAAASWTLVLSVVGSLVRATMTNSTGTTRGCRVSFELERVVSIP